MTAFQKYVVKMKEIIGGIRSFRQILVIDEDKDTSDEVKYKKIYRGLAEVFIKCFSVNWIIHGRMAHKDVYLKYRFRMLSKIRNPEDFTCLNEPKR